MKEEQVILHHHRKMWCHRTMYFQFKRYNAILNALSLLVTCTGLVIGPVLQNVLLTTILTAVGMFIKGWNDFKKYPIKMDMSKFAYSSHAKALSELRVHVQGTPIEDGDAFLMKQQTLEDVIIDFAPPIPDNVLSTYNHLFSIETDILDAVDGENYK